MVSCRLIEDKMVDIHHQRNIRRRISTSLEEIDFPASIFLSWGSEKLSSSLQIEFIDCER